jgi:hypothetical protein
MEPEHHVADSGSARERQEGGGIVSDSTRLWGGDYDERMIIQPDALSHSS